jgi:AcrR family transcriptional regulator
MAKKEELRRRQIIGAMAECVASDGFDGATMRKVAERTGASTGFITYYYTNKKELMTETLGAAQEHTRQRIQQFSGDESGLRFIEGLFDVFVIHRDKETLPWSFWLDFWAHASRDRELRASNAAGTALLRAEIHGAMIAGIADESLRPDIDPDIASDLVLALLNGLGVLSAVAAKGEFDARASEVTKLALAFIRA